jgi:hypothetical protein
MAGSSAAELLFNALDKNGDGVITRDEMRHSLAAESESGSGAKESVFTVAARTRALAQQATALHTSPERTSSVAAEKPRQRSRRRRRRRRRQFGQWRNAELRAGLRGGIAGAAASALGGDAVSG